MGYNRQDIEDSLAQTRYDDVFATYLLLGRKNTDVSNRAKNVLII
jgi:MAP/microtubule affinity-regulating kinase